MNTTHKTKSDTEDLKKRLKIKINEHKMLTNTLNEAFKRDDVSASTLNRIKMAIEDSLNDIALLREEIENGYVCKTYEKSSFFDKIKKNEKKKDELSIKVLSGMNFKYDSKRPYGIKSFDEVVKDEAGNGHEVRHTTSVESVNTDSILFCNRFLCDLNAIGIPETMVKWVLPYKSSEYNTLNRTSNFVEVQIYDFVDNDGVPVLAKLNAYDGRKFTIEIKHLDPTGIIVYKEKYNGCYLDGEFLRDSLRYADSEPASITFKIYYDGVSYEASCQKR